MPYSHEGYGLPESYPADHRPGGRRESRAACAGVWTPHDNSERPTRFARRRIWALVPRAVREQAPPRRLDWLPPRARAVLSRDLRRRNDLDRALATARGLDADAPECARFQGAKMHAKLDTAVKQSIRNAVEDALWPQ